MSHFLYLLGAPGSGKSSLVRALSTSARGVAHKKPFPHIEWAAPGGEVVELGARREKFSGTDALPMNTQPRAVAYVDAHPGPLLLAEGDRLANDGFFKAVQAAGYTFTLVWLDPPGEWMATRRAERVERDGGRLQNESWIRGRESKVNRLGLEWGAVRVRSTVMSERIAAVRALDNPVISAFRPDTIGPDG